MENNVEQSAVDWLVEQYKKVGGISISIAEKAKQMENEKLESLKDFETWKEWKNKSNEDE
jgi:hypothetical protein